MEKTKEDIKKVYQSLEEVASKMRIYIALCTEKGEMPPDDYMLGYWAVITEKREIKKKLNKEFEPQESYQRVA